ncbi:hypothetical protein SISNIDRAFT_489873 [Sistotremastrum niveocremeum HHB9708]|uniref:DUF6535 domain-containing protein n=1 Tax=Sistotremastrum niveocremeum HHB9708 TaxID=1314777 RepID=A0A164PDY4_9AGAM|nr:hypothetical protein SISNIDRAFT_489873 [Sistotremastrum niveocremeum HHB9708]
MSLPTEPRSLDNHSTVSRPTSPTTFESINIPLRDIQNTPAFDLLVSLIKEQNSTAKEQQKVMEDLREVMMDVKKALGKQSKFLKGSTRRQLKANVRKAVNEVARGIRGSDRASSPLLSTTSHAPSTTTARSRSTTAPESGEATLDMPGALSDTNRRSDPVPSNSKNASDAVIGEIETQAAALPNPMTEVIELLKSVKEVLSQHGSKFDILIKDAIKDDQPYELKPLEDESTCAALFEMAMTKTKEEVDEWIKRMDVSLVFIALFSAVLTAFVVPATQNLFPNSYNPGNPTSMPVPAPKISAQNVCVLYYLALILAISDAVLSVLGRQWMSKLTIRPEGSTYRERVLRHVTRETVAKRWLKYLVEGLHIILLASIGLFMTGLLSQLRNLAGSFDQETQRLLIAWKVGLLISSLMPAAAAAATMHSLIFEVSPFGGPFSAVLLKIFRTLSKPMKFIAHVPGPLEWVVSLGFVLSSVWECGVFLLILVPLVAVNMIALILGSPAHFFLFLAEWRVEFNTNNPKKLVGAFMDIMAESSQPILLERAAGSFSYSDWFENGEGTADQLEKTENRLLATDTSVRVRETLKARAEQFIPYDKQNWRELGPKMTKELVQTLLRVESYPEEFKDALLAASFRHRDDKFGDTGGEHLRGLSLLAFDECIACVLSLYKDEGKLGDPHHIFSLAQKHCCDLLEGGKRDDVTQILSHANRLDLITSFIQCPDYISHPLVEFIVKDRKHEILRKINEFVKTVDESRLGPRSLSIIFYVLASPPPTDIDLSPLIDYFSRHPRSATWRETSATTITYFTSLGVSRISDYTAVRRFLRLCINPDLESRDVNRVYLWQYTDAENQTRIRTESQTLLDTLDGITPQLESYPEGFREELLSASFDDNNADLQSLAALPFEECVARVLCLYNHNGKLGDRKTIFDLAKKHCHDLLVEGKSDDVTRILSHVDRLDLIKSYIQYPRDIYPSVVEFSVKDRKHELLHEINEFFKEVDQSRLAPHTLSPVFVVLASPPPTDIDLSPLIDYFSRHPYYNTWRTTSDTIISYLTSFDLSQFSDPTTVRRFLQLCIDLHFHEKQGGRYLTNDDTGARAHNLLTELDFLSSPPAGAIACISTQPASASHSSSHASPLNDASQPDPLLPHSADSPAAPAPENVDVDAVALADSHSDIPMTALDPPPVPSSSKPIPDPSLDSDSRAVFDQSPALENAHQED